MKGFAVVSRGIEEIASAEIQELINSKTKVEDFCVEFDFDNLEDLLILCYKAQSVDRILYLLGAFQFEDFNAEFEKFIQDLKLEKWMKAKKFRVECIREGKHSFNSAEVEGKSMKILSEKFGMKFDKNEFEIIFFVYIVNNKCYFGVDFAGFELNKRNYKIYTHASSIRGTIAYSLIRLSGFKENETLLDPFSRDGIIPIEAGFFATGFPVNYFRKDRFAFLKLKTGIDYEKFFQENDKNLLL